MVSERPTGLERRREQTTREWMATRAFTAAEPPATIVRTLSRMHNQGSKPSCVGHGNASGIESVVGYPVSSVRLWEAGRYLQGDGRDASHGTRTEYVAEWMERHGWCDYTDGEDKRATSLDTDGRIADTVASNIRANSRKGRVSVSTISPAQSTDKIVAQVVAALKMPSCYVAWGGGCQDGYFDPPADTVLGPEFRSGNDHGHCELIFGWDHERQAFLNKGSWGAWTHCTLPGGSRADGCCLLDPEVLRRAWEIDVVLVTP